MDRKCNKCGVIKPLCEFHVRQYKCKECRKIDCKIYYEQNKSKILDNVKKYSKNNFLTIKERNKQYSKNHKERLDLQRKQRENKRLKEDPQFRLSKILRRRVRDLIKGVSKSGSAVRDLGCSLSELKIYLECKFYQNPRTGEMMSWDNYGKNGWHVDHVVPLISFDLSKREDFIKAFHYTNLQPLWWFENLQKRDKIISNNSVVM